MDYNMAALVRQKVEEWNRNRAVNPSAPVQGFAAGGMNAAGIPAPKPAAAQPVGIVPGPVVPGGGDNTQLPVQSGEYIWPVEAVLALGKHVLDQQVMGLKREMGDTTPVNNAGPQVGLPMGAPEGYAEGGLAGIIKTIKDKIPPMPTFPNPLDPLKQALDGKKGYAEGGMYDDGTASLESLNDSTLGPLPDYAMNTTSVYKPDIVKDSAPVVPTIQTGNEPSATAPDILVKPATGIPATAPIAPPVEKNVPLESSSFLGNKDSALYAGLNQMVPENRTVGLPTQPKAQQPTGDIAYIQGTGKNATATYDQPSGYVDDTANNNGYFGKYELLNADYGKEGYRQGVPGIVEGPTQPTGSVRVMSGGETLDYTPMGVKDPYYKPTAFKVNKDDRYMLPDGTEVIGIAKPEAEKWTTYKEDVGGKKTLLRKNLATDKVEQVVSDSSTTNKISVDGAGHNNKDFRNESSMRKEFQALPEVKEFATIDSNAKRAIKALEESKGKGSKVAIDQSVITTFNKMLDPTSVVRESEYARTPQDTAVLNRIKGKWDKIREGGAGIASEDREAIVRMIRNYHDIASQQYNNQVDYYSGLANRYGYSPENIVRLGGKKVGLDVPSPVGGKVDSRLASGVDYFKANMHLSQDALLKEMKKRGWKDADITAAWKAAKGVQ